jgi:hypothetical protein
MHSHMYIRTHISLYISTDQQEKSHRVLEKMMEKAYICMYARVYIYVSIITYVFTYVDLYTHTHIHAYRSTRKDHLAPGTNEEEGIHIHVYMCIHTTCIYLPMDSRMYIRTYTYIYTHTHTHTHTYIYIYMRTDQQEKII